MLKQCCKEKAAIGLAFDGDGDRLIAVDEKGKPVSGDTIIALCASALQKEGKLKNSAVVTTVMSNSGLSMTFREMGIRHLRANVGDRSVLEKMLAEGAVIGGEDSGHIIFLEHHTTGDGIISGLQLVATLLKEGKPLSELAAMVPVNPQLLINIEVKSKPDLQTVPEVQQCYRAGRARAGRHGQGFCPLLWHAAALPGHGGGANQRDDRELLQKNCGDSAETSWLKKTKHEILNSKNFKFS